MRRLGLPALWALAALLATSAHLLGQEERDEPPERPAAPDSAVADSTRRLPEGVEILPDSMRLDFPDGEEQPEAPSEKRVPGYPASPAPDSNYSAELYEWDRKTILSSNATSLLGFLTDVVPGFTPIRANYFNGVHQLTEGTFGSGFVRILLDGRELPPLESGESDLVRIPLVYLDRVRVRRSAAGFTIEIFTRRHHEDDAYARFGGGVGSPKVELIHGIFSNGWGSAVTVAGAFDLLNVKTGNQISDRLDFWATAAFMPGSNRTGIQLAWKSQTIDRTGDDQLQLTRSDLALSARHDFTESLEAGLALSRNTLTLADSQLVEVNRVGVQVSASPRWGFLRGGVAFQGGGAAYPSASGNLGAGVRPTPWLGLDIEAEGSIWENFDVASVGGGVAIGPLTPVALVLRAGGATGRRGVSRPLSAEADSVSFDAFTTGLDLTLGPFELGGRISVQKLSRQLPFGAPFDATLEPGPPATVNAFEGKLTGPVIPFDLWIKGANPLTISGFWRHQTPSGDSQPFYLPADVARGRFGIAQDFFKGDLLVDLGLSLVYRSAMLTSAPGLPNPVPVDKLSRLNLDLLIQIKDFQIWLRADNLDRTLDEDIVGLPYPQQVFLLGVKWEFFN